MVCALNCSHLFLLSLSLSFFLFLSLSLSFSPPSFFAPLLEQQQEKDDSLLIKALDDGLVVLMEEHVLPQAWRNIPHSRFFADPDAFRRERMYNEQVNGVLLQRCDDLYSLFCSYATLTQEREGNVVGGEHSPTLLGYHEWLDLCHAAKLVGASSGKGGGKGGGKASAKKKATRKKVSKKKRGEEEKTTTTPIDESLRSCRISFALCQMTVVDELRRSRRRASVDDHSHATFVEFLEALCRLADMRADPKGADPQYQLSVNLKTMLDGICDAHDKINFWGDGKNKRRLWRVSFVHEGRVLRDVVVCGGCGS